MGQKKSVTPDTLPAGFTGWDAAPDTLPANFSGFDQPKAAPPPAPTASVSATPSGPLSWLNQAESDFRYGGQSTILGKLLHSMGAQGVNVGSQAGAGEQLVSPVLGTLHAAQGVAMTPDHPIAGPLKAAGGVLEAATLPASFMAPEAGETAAKVPGVLARLIPSTARAGETFSQVKSAAGNIPLDLTEPGNAALNIQRLSESGGAMPKVVRDFLKRASDPSKQPLTYSEARDFYSNASRLSADEAQRLTPVMKREVGNFRAALNRSLQGAADQVGQGQNYADAINEYARASRQKELVGDAAKYVGNQAVQKLPWLLGLYGAKKVYDATK